jgi:hypothetical protein
MEGEGPMNAKHLLDTADATSQKVQEAAQAVAEAALDLRRAVQKVDLAKEKLAEVPEVENTTPIDQNPKA